MFLGNEGSTSRSQNKQKSPVIDSTCDINNAIVYILKNLDKPYVVKAIRISLPENKIRFSAMYLVCYTESPALIFRGSGEITKVSTIAAYENGGEMIVSNFMCHRRANSFFRYS